MSILNVPGARLYYEARGAGPLLVIVPGAKGEAGTYQSLAEDLAGRYQVVTYDRRGFSRSSLDGHQDHDGRLATDTGDLRSLLTHLTDRPATVFGNSSGAIIALQLLARHPGLASQVVAHEPPTVNLLPDAARWRDFFDGVYQTYRAGGIPAAMRQFATVFSDTDRRVLHRRAHQPEAHQYTEANTTHWLEHELRQYPRTDPDLDALTVHRDQLLVAAGLQSRGHLTHRTAQALAGTIGLPLLELPGGHVGCVSHHTQFATELVTALDRHRRS